MFNKVLIANRGEIAIRVMRACKEIGVGTVAVYSDADKNGLFTKYADEAYPLNSSVRAESYLSIDKMIDTALKSGADAIHPGYGFLAENPKLGEECKKNGIILIGPSGEVIEAMGDKITSKQLMRKANIPTIPGTDEAIEDIDKARDIAEKIGYPVIIKASAGGGGIGMQTVYSEDELVDAIESTQSVAKANFGNATVFIEKYLENPRHIEFQVLADEHGNTVHVADRECSIQRRHQKLIEESPSPIMTDDLRERMGASAVEAAEYIDYTNAGTVEFLYSNGEYYFLEMNTRIQVEHPITEVVTGVDLVREQLYIAAGKELDITQNEVQVRGHAIECRINAENPLEDFKPDPGRITGYRSPGGIGVRVDSGIHMRYSIPHIYDSMISKLIVHGRNRNEAVQRMQRALSEYLILGVNTTIPFHKAIMSNPAFKSGNLTTHFIDDYGDSIWEETRKNVELFEQERSSFEEAIIPDKKIAIASAAVNSYLNTAVKARK